MKGVVLDVTGAADLYLSAFGGHDGNAGDDVVWVNPTLTGPKGDLKLTDLEWKSATCGEGNAGSNKYRKGGVIKVAGIDFRYGVSTFADSVIHYALPEGYTKFSVTAAFEKRSGKTKKGRGTVEFIVSTSESAGGGGTGPEHFAIPHTAAKAVVALSAAKECLAAVDDENLRAVAVRCLGEMHTEAAVNGLIARLAGARTDAVRAAILPGLFRLYQREAEWKPKTASDWWTTRPDDRGPYFSPVTWELSPKIKTAIEAGFAAGFAAMSDKEMKSVLVKSAVMNRIDPSAMYFGGSVDPLFAALSAERPSLESMALLKWDNDEVIAAARVANNFAKSVEATAGQTIGAMDLTAAKEALVDAHGDAEMGQQLFAQQGCIACHTVSEDQPPKGPYLGTAGGQFTREYLIESQVTLKPSMMPPGLLSTLTVEQAAGLIEYLGTLK
jgi:mono/diheme cytochrome c family protein